MRCAWLPALALLLAACGGSPKVGPGATPGASHTDDESSNPFLDRIPADTPYFYVSTVSSEDYMRSRLENPAWREILAGLERVEKNHPEAIDRLDPTEKLGFALLVELAPGLSHAFENAGIPASTRFAIYGLDLMPVMRVEIDDAARFAAAFTRIEARVGALPTLSQRSGYEIRRYQADEMIVVVAIGPRDVAVAMTDESDVESTVAALVDPDAIDRSLADDHTVSRLVARHRLPASYVGAVDLAQIAAALAELVGGGALDGPGGDARGGCLRELSATPILVAFGGSMAADGVHSKISIEIDAGRAERFASARAPIPGSTRIETEGVAAALALGLDVGAALREIRTQVSELGQRFDGCTGVESVTAMANQAIDQLLTSPVTQVRGLSFLLRDGDLAASPPRIDHALAFVGASDPSSLVTLAAALLGVQAPVLAPGDPPARFEVPPALGDVVHLALSPDFLGVAMGAGAEVELVSKLAEPAVEPGALMLLRLDPRLLVALDDGELDDFATLAAEDPALADALREYQATDLLRFRDLLVSVDLEDEAIAIYIDMLFADRQATRTLGSR